MAARKAFFRSIVSLTDETRRNFKAGLLEMHRDRILAAAATYFGRTEGRHGIAVVSGRKQLDAANRRLGNHSLQVRRI